MERGQKSLSWRGTLGKPSDDVIWAEQPRQATELAGLGALYLAVEQIPVKCQRNTTVFGRVLGIYVVVLRFVY